MAENRSTEVVPGMAEAVEARRKALGMGPGELAAAAGITPEGLMPIRRGLRRQYQDKVRIGVARALGWPVDAIDRLLAGEDPSSFDPDPTPPVGPAGALDPDAIGLAAKAGQLTPEGRAKVEGYIERLLDEQDG